MRKYILCMTIFVLSASASFAQQKTVAQKVTTEKKGKVVECPDAQKKWFVVSLTCAQQSALSPALRLEALTNPANYGAPLDAPPDCEGETCICAIFACVSNGHPDFGTMAARNRIYGEIQAWVSSGTTSGDLLLKN